MPGFAQRRQSICALAVALAAAFTATAAFPTGASAATVLGFNDSPETFTVNAQEAQQAGATLARIPVNWAMTESSSPSILRWSELDAAVQELGAHGITPLFVIFSAPESAAGDCEPDPPSTCGVAEGHTDDYVEFAVELLDRYPGSLAQSWNEPDIGQYGGMRSRRIATLTNALAAAAPGRVIGPGASPANPRGLRYTRRAYRRIDRGVPMAMHFYPRSPVAPDGYRPDWRKARKIARGRPIWVTEVGYASSSYGLDGQARELAATYRFLAGHGASVIIVHRLRDVPSHDSPWLSSMGLLDQEGAPKPAYGALQRVAAQR